MTDIQTKLPTHGVFITKPGNDNKTFWSRIGGAWEHKDGNGLFIKLDTLPVNGEVVIRRAKAQTERNTGAA